MPLGWGNHPSFFEDMLSHFDKEISKVKGSTYYGDDWNDPTTGKCKHLQPDGSCAIYNETLPLVCKIFPVHPRHIKNLDADSPLHYDKCTYYFEEVSQEQIDTLLAQGKIKYVRQDTYEEVLP